MLQMTYISGPNQWRSKGVNWAAKFHLHSKSNGVHKSF